MGYAFGIKQHTSFSLRNQPFTVPLPSIGRVCLEKSVRVSSTPNLAVLKNPHKPIIHGTDEAIWSRIPLIPFSVTIPVKERDPFLLDKLKAESSGILNWALDGCLLWQRHRLSPPEEVHEATKEYRDEMDVLSDFLDEYCVISHNSIAISKRLWEAYNDCMKTTNEKYPLTSLN